MPIYKQNLTEPSKVSTPDNNSNTRVGGKTDFVSLFTVKTQTFFLSLLYIHFQDKEARKKRQE